MSAEQQTVGRAFWAMSGAESGNTRESRNGRSDDGRTVLERCGNRSSDSKRREIGARLGVMMRMGVYRPPDRFTNRPTERPSVANRIRVFD